MKRFAWIGLAVMLLALAAPIGAYAGLVPGEEVTAAFAVDITAFDLVAMACDVAAAPAFYGAETYERDAATAPLMDDRAGSWQRRPGGFDILKEPFANRT